MTPTEASTGSVEDAKAASPQRANGLSPGSGPAPNSEPINPLPPVRTRSIDLRTRRPSATASRRRFNEHWDVRRPRALGEGKPRSVPTRRKPDPVVQDPVGGSPAQSEATSGDAPPASEGVFDENTLSLLDDALCCALDQATLDEIVEEFAGRLETLSGEDGRRAEAIMRRHAARVASLARQTEVKERGDG